MIPFTNTINAFIYKTKLYIHIRHRKKRVSLTCSTAQGNHEVPPQADCTTPSAHQSEPWLSLKALAQTKHI